MTRIGVLLTALAVLAVAPAGAQSDSEDWEYQLAVYLVLSNFEGEIGVGSVDAEIDLSFSDILDNLDTGFMSAFRAEKGPWALMADIQYVELNPSDSSGPVDAELDVEQLILEVDGTYEVVERLEVLGGLRHTALDNRVVLDIDPPRVRKFRLEAEDSESWVDPVIGVRWTLPFLADKGAVVLRADVGGFGVGSDLVWNAVARVTYRASEHFDLALGYRILDYDYEDGSGSDRFRFDVRLSGPLLAAVFRF